MTSVVGKGNCSRMWQLGKDVRLRTARISVSAPCPDKLRLERTDRRVAAARDASPMATVFRSFSERCRLEEIASSDWAWSDVRARTCLARTLDVPQTCRGRGVDVRCTTGRDRDVSGAGAGGVDQLGRDQS